MRSAFLAVLFVFFACAANAASSVITPSFSDIAVTYTKEERLVLTGKTNLPDGTVISSLILQTEPVRKGLYADAPLDYPESFDVTVKGGTFASWFPTVYEKGITAGKYTLQIGTPPGQDALLGPQNAWLSGPDVKRESNGLKTLAWEISVSVPDLPGHGKQAAPAEKW